MTERPLFLLDIDGVTNVFDGWVHEIDEFMTRVTGKTFYARQRTAPAHLRASWAAGYSLLLNPMHPAWIAEIEAAGFDTCWATMWQGSAATDFGPVAGFGTGWDHIDFHAFHQDDAWRNAGRTGLGVGGYKAPGIEAVAGDTPTIWVDDDLQPANYAWADRRNAAGIPTLLLQPDPAVGMTRAHIDAALEFAADLDLTPVLA